MHPILLKINLGFTLPVFGNTITVYTYGFLVAIGFLVAVYISAARSKYYGINKEIIFDAAFYCILFGIIGARLLYVIVSWEQFEDNLLEIFYLHHGGIVFYGGFIGGFIALIIFAKKKRINLLKLTDLFAPQVALGHAFGRLGCLAFGCCYGAICNVKWLGMRFPFGSPAFEEHLSKNLILNTDKYSLPVIPTQLLECIFLILLFFFLFYISRKIKKNGMITSLYLMLYSMFRIIIEFFRADYRGFKIFGVLYISQFISILLFIVGLSVFLKIKKIK